MKITPDLFHAYLKCPTKCWLRATGEQASGNDYAEWVKAKADSYRNTEVKRLVGDTPSAEVALSPDADQLKAAKWQLATGLLAQATTKSLPLESSLHAIERIPSAGRGRAVQFIPIRCIFTNKLSKDDKLLLAFDSFVMSQAIGREIRLGKIIHGDDHTTLKVKTSALGGEVRKRLDKIAALLSNPAPPDLILNRHCSECGFQARCRQKALEQDELSLLGGMSAKERQKLRSKGIFTITQLSHTFRPRRRPKRQRDKREKYHHSVKALAIREKKIHIVGSPELKIEGTPVYLDIEGLPDEDFYYLIGLRIGSGETATQHSLWADSAEGEGKIWQKFISILKTVKNPVLIHYGSYEATFFRLMCERYGKLSEGSVPAKAIQNSINLLFVTFARIYFPTYSNGLKEIAGHLGFRWSDPTASGVQSISWRHEWESSKSSPAKQSLITYNAEDCKAVEVLTGMLVALHQMSPQAVGSAPDDVIDIDKLKWERPYGFKRNTFAIPAMDVINKAAYWDYQRERVYVRSDVNLKRALRQTSRPKSVLAPDKTVVCPRPPHCPNCGSSNFFVHGKASKTVFDLKFMKHGIKRWISRYQFQRFRCQACFATFFSERCWTRCKFGSELIAYALYQNIGLRLPQESVVLSINKLFGLHLPIGTAAKFKNAVARVYEETHQALVKRLCSGHLLHADETQISVRGKIGYVWVFANLDEVAYIYSETREAEWLQVLLKDFDGVLVSDFYTGYDGIQCRQQKCLIHLIRDLNDDILKHPYDEDLKQLSLAFADLVKPMVETVDRHGLKTRFLKKHLGSVDRFYRQLSAMVLRSEEAVKLRGRFQKQREHLFTFLSANGVPWNNNNAEHAVKAFATLRHIIKGVTTEKGIREYLILLSICETCRYKELDFLDFLRSGEKDIQAFAESQRGRRRVPRNLPSPDRVI